MGVVMSSIREVVSACNIEPKVDAEDKVFLFDYQNVQNPSVIQRWIPAQIQEEHEKSSKKRVSCYFCANTPLESSSLESFGKNDEYFLKRNRRSTLTLQSDCLVEETPPLSTVNLVTFKGNDTNTMNEEPKLNRKFSSRDKQDAVFKGLNSILSLPNLGKPILKPKISEKMETVIRELKVLNKERKAGSMNCEGKNVNVCRNVNDNPSTAFLYEQNENDPEINQPVKTMRIKEPSAKSYRQILDTWHYVDEIKSNAKRTVF